ncbi:MAG TPA: thiamine pyrophosphate-dependent enzyme [Verrucomicrobiae bacterium]|nr:thiamine pyrophosphate-dependent enzyme [Verrucomicrobiae bacterium]
MALKIEDLPKEDLFGQGNAGCRGCGAAIAGRQAMKALGSRTIVTIPASCMATLSGSNQRTAWSVPFYHTLFEIAPAVSSGIRAGLDVQGIKDVNVVSWAGDAGTADIGFQALTGAAERNEAMMHVCYDNEMYMNTGGQTGSQTPLYAVTSNMGKGKPTKKKNMLAIMEAHGIDYVASANIAYPLDLIAKFKKAAANPGFSYIHILAPCYRGWNIPAEKTVEFARLAVECGLWELFEVENGVRTRTHAPSFIPVEDYLLPQGRFKHLTPEQLQSFQDSVNKYYGRGI